MIKKILLRILLAMGLVILVLAVNLFICGALASRVSEGTAIKNIQPQNKALLIIDIQEGTTGSVSSMKSLREQSGLLIERVNTVIEEMHAKGQLIVYVHTEVANPLINILNNTMARGTQGAELDQRLVMDEFREMGVEVFSLNSLLEL